MGEVGWPVWNPWLTRYLNIEIKVIQWCSQGRPGPDGLPENLKSFAFSVDKLRGTLIIRYFLFRQLTGSKRPGPVRGQMQLLEAPFKEEPGWLPQQYFLFSAYHEIEMECRL